MDEFIKSENASRRSNYRKSDDDELFLIRCNEALKASSLPPHAQERADLPFIFVVGPPRSGTTLAMQLLAHCLDVGYINNLIARFWDAPVHGARLSRIVLSGQRTASFHSEFGVTPLPTDPHEFGYFWSSLFGSRDHLKTSDQVDWDGLRKTLFLLAGEFDRPLAFKNLLLNHHVEQLAAHLPRVVLIRIWRDPLDNAISIMRAREAYYGDRNRWWSLRSGYRKGIEDRCWTEQIASQLAGLRDMLDKSLPRAARSHGAEVVNVNYNDLCNSPDAFIDKTMAASERLGVSPTRTNKAPALTPEEELQCADRTKLRSELVRTGLLEGAS